MKKHLWVLVAIALIFLIGSVSADNTKLLLHFEGTNGSTTYTDETGKSVGGYGSPVPFISTATDKFGSSSVRLDDDDAMLTLSDSDDWALVGSSFTVDMWVNLTAPEDSSYLFNYPDDAVGSYECYYRNSSGTYFLQFKAANLTSGTWLNTTQTTPIIWPGIWNHIAVVGNDTYLGLYLNGTLVSSSTTIPTTSTGASSGFYIGGWAGSTANSVRYIDEFRVTKGEQLWTGNFTPPTTTSETSWSWTTPGTYYWVCPDGITKVYLNLGGGGGSGKGAFFSTPIYKFGYGGTAGEWANISNVDVTPGTNYTIVVGKGGNRSLFDAASNPGTSSYALGYTKSGGAGGLSGTTNNHVGGDAIGTGFMSASLIAEDGEDIAGYAGGSAATGYCAAGGGGPASTSTAGYGGAGAGGYVGITVQDLAGANVPDFSASPLTGSGGTLVHFTDISTIRDSTNITYLWNFGDDTTSNTSGNVNHVFSYTGIYTVSLTLTSDIGTSTETKTDYITISSQDYYDPNKEPKRVQFHVQTFWGQPLVNANVSILGITTSTGSWDWLVTLLGIPLDEVAINGTAMYQETDSLGNTEFLMIPSAKYNITTTLTGYEFPNFYVTPHDERYTIIANLNGTGWFQTGNNTLEQINVTVSSVKLNDTAGRINVSYIAETGVVSGGVFSVYRKNQTDRTGPNEFVTFLNGTGDTYSASTEVPLTDDIGVDNSYTVTFTPTVIAGTELVGGNDRSFAVWFKGKPVDLGGFDSTILMWFALFIIIFTAMFAGATHAPQMAIIICVEAWVFYAMGWLDNLTEISLLGTTGGDGGVVLLLSLATFVSVLWNFHEGKRKAI